MKYIKQKKIRILLILTVILTLGMLMVETFFSEFQPIVIRNGYGKGSKIESYEVEIEGEEGKKTIQLTVWEEEYEGEEVQEMFRKVIEELDHVILGENQSFDRVETSLHLVEGLDSYPVEILWELDSYDVLNIDGSIRAKELSEEGTLVELRATIFYRDEEATYIRSVMVYPLTRMGIDKILHDLQTELENTEAQTRADGQFSLPEQIGGRKLTWSQRREVRWPYVLLLGGVLVAYLIYKEVEMVRAAKKRREEVLKKEYPGLISRLTMLLSTGATLRSSWERIVDQYVEQKEEKGSCVVYEEMRTAIYEMKSGISEAEAYERFGKRCGIINYVKLGALLSQNLRKGSKGLSELLRMEAIQAFENRKSRARQKGEEAGAKLLMPMMGMLAVVFVMILVPAFVTLQI